MFGICLTWVRILDGFEYQSHNSLDMHIMANHVTCALLGIPDVNFELKPSHSLCAETLQVIHDVSPGFCQIPIYVYIFPHFLHFINLGALSWLFGVQTIT